MTNEYIQEILTKQFPEVISAFEEQYGIFSMNVQSDKILSVLNFLNQEPSLGFQFLTDITGVHFPDRKNEELCVVYHLHNLVANKRIRLKAYLPISNPVIPSSCELYSSANWMERETFDFFGIQFEGHPNLVRILNVDEMDYFPMRKEYPMEDPTRMDKDDEMFGR
jgi:NADH-quinone oxidoreductase subunit C